MTEYKFLQTLAFKLKENLQIKQLFYTLDFPRDWIFAIREIYAYLNKRNLEETQIPIKTLNQALSSLAPNLIAIKPGAGNPSQNDRRWLYGVASDGKNDPFEIKALNRIIIAWLDTEVKLKSEQRKALLNELNLLGESHVLSWQKQDQINLNKLVEMDDDPQGSRTIKFTSDVVYSVIPDWIAAELTKDNFTLNIGDKKLKFYRCRTNNAEAAEIMSWPPEEGLYSIVLKFSLRTIPTFPKPLIFVEDSIRRWVTVTPEIDQERATGVYVFTTVPWLEGFPYSNSFQKVPIIGTESKNKPYKFSRKLTDILSRIKLEDKFIPPNPEWIVNKFAESLRHNNPELITAIAYIEGMKPLHKVDSSYIDLSNQVTPGLNSQDKQRIYEALTSALQEYVEPLEALSKLEFNLKGTTFESLANESWFITEPNLRRHKNKDETEEEYQERLTKKRQEKQSEYEKFEADAPNRRSLVCQGIKSEKLIIEILYQNQETLAALQSAINRYFGDLTSDELTVNVKSFKIGSSLISRLQFDVRIKNKQEQIADGVNQRIEAIKEDKRFTHETIPQLILAEILPPKHFYFDPKSDPIQALRKGFGNINRVTQFILPAQAKGKRKDNEKELNLRSQNALLDGLRMLGVNPPIRYENIKDKSHPEQEFKYPENLSIFGVWLVMRTSKTSLYGRKIIFPIFSYLPPGSSQVLLHLPGIKDWLDYREALLRLAKDDRDISHFADYKNVTQYIQKTVTNDINGIGDALLLCHAQNIRRVWPWVSDAHIDTTKISFGEGKTPYLLKDFPKLRIVRIRDEQRMETPPIFAVNNPENANRFGISKGLFQINDKVWYSSAQKPTSASNTKKGISKIISSSKDEYKKQVWNPRTIEIFVATVPPKEESYRWAWAALVHDLRFVSYQFGDALKLPLPLHFAEKADEYIITLQAQTESDQLEGHDTDF